MEETLKIMQKLQAIVDREEEKAKKKPTQAEIFEKPNSYKSINSSKSKKKDSPIKQILQKKVY